MEHDQTALDNRYLTRIDLPAMGWFLLLTMLFLTVYKDTVIYLLNDWMQWQNGEYAHGFVVLAVAGYMLWDRRETLQQILIRPELLGLTLILVFSMLWMIGTLLGIRIVESLSFFLLIPSIIFALAGRQFVTRLWFPLTFLLVAFPVWDLFLPYLQSLAASISHRLLQLTGTTVLREDAYLIVPAGKFLVAEGCSGLRYLLAAMTFSGFYIYLERLTQWRAVTFFVTVVCAAILANAFRITTVIIAGNLTEMQHPWVHDHLMLGWYIFAAMLVPVFMLGNKLSDVQQATKNRVTVRKGYIINDKPARYSVLLPMLIIALMTGPILKIVLLSRAQSSSASALLTPAGQGDWKLSFESNFRKQSLQPNYEGADSIVDQLYSDSNQLVRLYTALYVQQRQDKELINVNNHLYAEEYWQVISRQLFTAKNSENQFIEVQLKNNNGDEKVIWYWYRTAGQITTRPVITKLLDLYGMVIDRNASSVIMISANKIDGLEKTRNHLSRFYTSMIRNINANLDAVNN